MVFVSSVLGKSVSFLPNGSGSTGTMATQTDSATANLNSNTFTRSGYTFTGWNTQEDGQGTPYTDGASYSFAANMTLYAQWTPVQSQSNSPSTSNAAVSTNSDTALLANTGIDVDQKAALALSLITFGFLCLLISKRHSNY